MKIKKILLEILLQIFIQKKLCVFTLRPKACFLGDLADQQDSYPFQINNLLSHSLSSIYFVSGTQVQKLLVYVYMELKFSVPEL